MNNQTAKRKICAVILWIMLLFWMAFIFSMSSQEASESSKSSGEVIETILKMVKPDYESLTATEKYELIDSLQFIVRKIAHFTGYTIIGILSYWALFSTFSLKYVSKYRNHYHHYYRYKYHKHWKQKFLFR